MSLIVYNKNRNLSDEEFLEMAEDFATKNYIFHGIFDEDDKYIVEFHLRNTVTGDTDDWLELQRASDFSMFSVMDSRTEMIKLTLCRVKR